jgi:hypothetical protein
MSPILPMLMALGGLLLFIAFVEWVTRSERRRHRKVHRA